MSPPGHGGPRPNSGRKPKGIHQVILCETQPGRYEQIVAATDADLTPLAVMRLAFPSLFQTLQERSGDAARALALLTLTAARSGEVLGARWSEFDLEQRTWIVPAECMKSGRVHRVPLTPEALALLGEPGSPDELVFPTLGVNALSNELRHIRPGVTVHGMRSSFRDWASDYTSHEPEVAAEAALAHVVGDKTERAYRRGDAFDKRRALMRDWAAYLTSKPEEVVVPFQAGRR